MNYEDFISKLDPKNYKLNEPMSLHTTVRIGGPADIWYEAQSSEDFVSIVKLAREHNIPITILGWGANSLVGDKGVRGVVIRNKTKKIEIVGKPTNIEVREDETQEAIQSRWESDNKQGTFRGIEFKDLDYDESSFPRVEVKMDSGVDLPFAINYLIRNGVTGLQWYAKIPGTIGGAIFNNIHGGTHFLSEVLKSVTVLTSDSEIKTYSKEELGVDYDKSRFHDSNEIILNGTFELYLGDAQKAQAVAIEWAKRKASQPPNSTGSVFKNISVEMKDKLGYPTTSIGYIIEHVLKMSGFKVGDAAISTTSHNFIINEGKATARDYIAVIDEIKKRAKEQIGIDLHEEIFYLGEF